MFQAPQSAWLVESLQVRPALEDAGRADHTLAGFEFDGVKDGRLATGLGFLGGSLEREFWQVDRAVETVTNGDFPARRAGGLMLVAAEVPDRSDADPAATVHSVYRRLLAQAAAAGHPWLLRVWNYMPAINAGEGDDERYRRFCIGRGRALDEAGHGGAEHCAATAIGGDDPTLRVYALCASDPVQSIENPRQTSAYDYPRIYGPKSPVFARATAVPGPSGDVTLMISGTASVVGHRTRHPGDLDGQLDEIVRNVQTLLQEAVRRLDAPGLGELGENSLLRVYLRSAGDWPRARARVETAWPDARIAGFRGDICRSDLVVEIEAVTRAAAAGN